MAYFCKFDKISMKYSSAPLILSLLLLPTFASASEHAEGKLNEDVWYLNTTVMINGSHLQGPIPSQSKLCFAPEALKTNRICFSANHPNITKWTPSNVTFVPPRNVPPKGVVILTHPKYVADCYYDRNKARKCNTKIEKEYIEISSYKAHPYIAQVIDSITEEEPEMIHKGRRYEVKGYRMGNHGMGIYMGVHKINTTDIDRWTHDSILFTASKDYPAGTELRVHNGAGKGSPWIVSKGLEENLPEQLVVTGNSQESSETEQDTESKEEDTEEATGEDEKGKEDENTRTGEKDLIAQSLEEGGPAFDDIPATHAYYDAIAWARINDVVGGFEDNTFRPEAGITRAALLKIIIEADENIDITAYTEGDDPFVDVPADAWHAPYIRYAKKHNLVDGFAGNTFRPAQQVTLPEALKILYRFFRIPTLDPQTKGIWYARYLEHAIAHRILFTVNLEVDSPLPRKDVVWIVWKLLEHKERYNCLPY